MTRTSNIPIILLYTILLSLFWGAAYTSEPVAVESFTPWAKSIDTFAVENPEITLIFTALLTIVISFMVTQLTIRRIAMLGGSFLPALLFLTISSGLCNSAFSIRALLSTLFIIISINNLLQSSSIKGPASGIVILSGFWVSLAVLIFPQSYTVLVAMILGLAMLRDFDLLEWIAIIVGMAIVPVFIALISYVMGYQIADYLNNITMYLSQGKVGYELIFLQGNPLQLIFIGILVLLFLLSMSGGKRRGQTSNSPQERRVFRFFILFTWIIAISLLLSPEHSLYFSSVAALPLSIVLASSLKGRGKRIIANILYALLIACALLLNFADDMPFTLQW